jgi:hypothetical protein
MKRHNSLIAGVVVTALLVACGGGGGGSADDNSVPATATESTAAYTDFTVALAATPSESADPLNLDSVAMPPTSETDDPVPLN